MEPIVLEWENFARSIWPGAEVDPAELRDHAEDMLRATIRDMNSPQTAQQRIDKSRGMSDGASESNHLLKSSVQHGSGRVDSGFDLLSLVAEYRALRASVLHLWQQSRPDPDPRDLEDLMRFNECIDQSLTHAVASFTKRLDQSRQMFLAILGHDLRNPLGAVSMAARGLGMAQASEAETKRFAAVISSSAAAMSKMISDLIDYTAVGLGSSMPLSPSPMDLARLCSEVIDEMRAAHPECTIHFKTSGELHGAWDVDRLRQVISNLIGNAIQHGDIQYPVQVELADDGPTVRLDIRNQGPPIPRGSLPTIFEPLVTGPTPDIVRPRRAGSLGLGLYIVRAVVIAHGGTIGVESNAADGTHFTVRLPRRRAARTGL